MFHLRMAIAVAVTVIGELAYGGFNWHGGNFDAGAGSFARIDDGIRLTKESAPGGAQAFAASEALGDAEAAKVSFRYRGAAFHFRFSHAHREDGKLVPTKDGTGQTATGKWELPASKGWTNVCRTISIPSTFRLPGNVLRFHVQLWGGREPTAVELVGLSVVPCAEPRPVARRKLDVAVKPLPNKTPYGPLARLEKHDYRFEKGWLSDGGKPVFLVGNGCDLGAAQATPTGLWLAKLQGVGMLSLESGMHYGASKVVDDHVDIQPWLSVGNVSWQREALRLGMLTESCNGHGQFKWSGIRDLAVRYPDFGEIHGYFGHGLSIDNHTDLGRRILLERRLPFVDLIAAEGDHLFELSREPGADPCNMRVKADFRIWARRKYGTLQEACRVWRRTYSGWDDVLPIHLDDRQLATKGNALALKRFARANYPEMYYDWLAFVQEQTLQGTLNEVTDLRSRHPELPYGIDTRAHTIYSDGYCAYDPVRIDGFMDFMLIHNGYHSYAYNNEPWHEETLAHGTWFPLLLGGYFRRNTTHPILNAEDVVSVTSVPGSDLDAMAKNDLGQLHASPWKFHLEEAGEDGLAANWRNPAFDDSDWGDVVVPGCWDAQDAYKGRNGIGWYRKTFVCTGNRQDYLDGSRKFLLYGKGVAQSGTVWLNGEKVGDVKGWDASYKFDIGALLKFGQKNTIVWRVDGSRYFQQGLRTYCHILAHDMINVSRPLGEKQYASMYWNYLMHGLSGVFTWNWNKDVLRPYLAQISAETKFAAGVALPDIRTRHHRVAMLYGYLNGRGLPSDAEGDDTRYMAWFNALLAAGHEPDVLGEDALVRDLSPEAYDLLVVPHCAIVSDETLAKVRAYVEKGGRLVITADSLRKTFSRYADQPPIKGAVIAGNGLGLKEAAAFLKPYLPPPEIAVSCAPSAEMPIIARQLAGDARRKILFVYNWGGIDQDVTLTLPKSVDGWHLTSIRGVFSRREDGSVVIRVPSQGPVAAVLDRDAPVRASEFSITPKHRAEIDRVVALNETVAPEKADVLFPWSVAAHTPSGKELYPEVLAQIKARGLTHAKLEPEKWTAELLKDKKVVIIPEHSANHGFGKLAKDNAFRAMLRKYVEDGGRLLLLGHTARTINSGAPLMESLGREFGYRCGKGVVQDPSRAGFGDPYQILAETADCGDLTKGVGKVQLYVLSPLVPTKDSAAKVVVPVPDGAAMLAIEHGNGRVFVSSDNMFCQPYRITEAGNAALLENIVGWLLRTPVIVNYSPGREDVAAAVVRINGVKDCFAIAAGENVAQAELDDDDNLQSVCQRLVDEAVASGEQGGVQFCAYKDGKCIVDVWAGTLSTNAGAAKVDGRTLFPIFSTEKPLLATAVHRAVEKGLMDYDKPLCTWWPEFTGDGKERLTLGLTLGYRSGMPAKLDPAVFPTVDAECDWSRICKWAAAVKPELEPGTKQRYMSLSYGWYLGHPLEVACGKPLKDCLDELVLEPAGITDDFFFVTNERCESRIATFYGNASVERMNDRRRWRFCLPSAYAVANARSVARFYNRLCGFDGKEPLIRKATLDNALKPCRHPSDPLPDAETMKDKWFMIFGMGYGLWGEAERMDRVFGHGGAGGSEGLVDRDNRLVVAYTCNFDNYKGGLRQRLYDAVGMKWRYWKDKKADIQTLQMKTVNATRPRPNAAQLSRIRNGIERWGIVHWGLNTYTDREWGYGDEDPRLLDPDAFDADQIVSACKDGGLQGLVVVAKHHDGFCLWPTRTTAHNIGKSPFRGGRGDYVREMEQACRRAGLRFGVYCSPWDRNNADYATPKYVETYHAQIRELLDGRYGEIFEMWFDGANGGDGYYGGARERRKIPEGYYEFDKVFGFVRELQPNVCIFGMGGEYRWPGNEEGFLSDESRATTTSDKKRPDYTRIKNTGLVDGDLFSICEADFPLRKGWFYHASESNTVRSGEFLMQRYLKTVGNGGAMNIGIAPNRHGRLDESDVRALRRFNEIRGTFFGKEVGEGEAFNVVVLKEDVANGEQVDGWELVNDGETIAKGSAIGIKRIRAFDSPRVARQCHVRVTAGGASPDSAEVRLYSVDVDLLRLVLTATTENGETDTAKWMTLGGEKR